AAVAVIVGAGDVGDGVTDEQIGGHGVGGLNAGTGQDVDPAVARDGFHDDVEIVAELGEITESAGEIGQRGAADRGGGVGGGGAGQKARGGGRKIVEAA